MFVLGEHSRGVRRQRAQQRELLLRELDPLPAQARLARGWIDLQLAHPQAAEPRAAVGAVQERPDASAKLGIAERLGQRIIVRAVPGGGVLAAPAALPSVRNS